MSLTAFPNGVSSFGVPVFGTLPAIRGKYFFVDPVKGLAGGDGTKEKPVNSISVAYTKCTDGVGDGIVIIGKQDATSADCTSYLSSSITWSKSGITVVGVCAPTMFGQRARISNASTLITAPYLINVTGHSNSFYNISMFNGGSNAAALGCLQVTGNRNYFYNCHVVGAGHATPSAATGATNLELIGATENTFEKCIFGTDTINRVGTLATWDIAFYPNVAGTVGCQRNVFKDCMTLSQTTSGQAAHLALYFGTASNAIDRNQYFFNCHFDNWNLGAVSAQTSLVGGTYPNNGWLVLHKCSSLGYADWDAGSAAVTFTDNPSSAADGGAMTAC